MQNDWLLKITRVAIIITRILLIIAGALMALGIAVVLFASADAFTTINEGAAAEGIELTGRAGLGLVFAVGLAAIVLIERFLSLLKQVIDSLPQGDPFVPENATRLERMGWLALAMQGLGLLAGIASTQLGTMRDKMEIDVDFSLEGIFLALLLFILARVFRKGTEMRDDLEGTV